jgi:hypothetical protein
MLDHLEELTVILIIILLYHKLRIDCQQVNEQRKILDE